jgi:predicted ester cyclase
MEKSNLTVLRNIVELAFGNCDLSVIDELMDDNCIEHQFGMSGGKEGLKNSILSLHSAFPDMQYQLQHACEADGLVWVHYQATGTNTGSFMHNPPSGKKFKIDVIDIARVINGRITEHWGMPDRFALMKQLGLMNLRQPAE